uniref:transposase n=1 Tax=Methylobacter marinus TaxID=34058 RepID=UPI0018DCF8E8|nr:transposase [Methylobacter marinus]
MNQEKQKVYSAELRASAVKLATESDQSIAQTAKDLGINANTLHTWISKYSRPKTSDKAVRTDEHLYDELKRLKKKVARLTEERGLLKKVATELLQACCHLLRLQRETLAVKASYMHY